MPPLPHILTGQGSTTFLFSGTSLHTLAVTDDVYQDSSACFTLSATAGCVCLSLPGQLADCSTILRSSTVSYTACKKQTTFSWLLTERHQVTSHTHTVNRPDEAITILLDPNHNSQRNKQYEPVQRRYIAWARLHQIDLLTPNPVHLINFLAYGRVHHYWTAGTCATYHSAILDLYSDCSIITNNTVYHEFFVALNEQTIRSFN